MKFINWGIIGCGDVTEIKSGPAFNKIEGSKLVAVMRRNKELAADYAKRHQVPKYYDDADKLIHDTDINAIYVATPPESHAEYAIRAMRAGKPVYVEKPMAMNDKECQQMVEVSKEYRVPLFVAYYRRTLPGFLQVKELIEEGLIGKILTCKIELFRAPLPQELDSMNRSWRVNPSLAGAGLFYDLASHQLDFLDFIFGPVISSSGFACNNANIYKAEDTVTASFNFSNGISGTGTWCFVSDENSERDIMEIVGTKGRIVFSGFNHHPIKLYTKNKVIDFPYLNPENIQYNLIKQVVEELQGVGSCISTGATALRTNVVMQNIVKEYYTQH